MRPQSGWDVLQNEILGEQALTVGRLGSRLRAALDVLKAFDERMSSGKTKAADRLDGQRARLVDDAAYALWTFVVQRDCSGFRFTEQVLKQYGVPPDVRAKMGAVRPR